MTPHSGWQLAKKVNYLSHVVDYKSIHPSIHLITIYKAYKLIQFDIYVTQQIACGNRHWESK